MSGVVLYYGDVIFYSNTSGDLLYNLPFGLFFLHFVGVISIHGTVVMF